MPALSEIKPSKESSYDDTNPNACACCPEPCRVCLQPLSTACSTVKLDLKLHGQMWKASFGKPSACGRCLSPKAFFAVRLSIFIIWLACTLWSMINWVTEEELGFDYWCATLEHASPSRHTHLSSSLPLHRWTKLTHWTATYELIYLGFAMMTTYRALWGSTPDGTGDQTPWFVSVTWAMQSSVLPISFFVCILYWALVYDPDKGLGVLSVLMHGLNFVLAFADMLLCRQPMYLCHIFLPLAYGEPRTATAPHCHTSPN